MTPSKLAGWLLKRALKPDAAEAVAGDLSEEFQARARTHGALSARAWLWRQTLTSIAAALWARAFGRSSVHGRPGDSHERAGLLDSVRRDLRWAVRSLLRAPAFTIAAVATLAVGIGASTAIGTAASRALIRPLPYPTGERLVFLGHPNEDGSVGNVGFATAVDWRARLTRFDELSIVRAWTPTLVADTGAAPLAGMKVNWNYFRMLGVRPALGRDFTAADDHPERWRVVMLSDGLWRRQFGARPEIVGSTIEFNGRAFQVIGVLPASFEPVVSERFFARAEIWAPLGYSLTGDSSCRSCQHLKLVGRLTEDATLSQAVSELAVVHADLRRQYPTDYTAPAPAARWLEDEIARPIRRPLQVLLAAVLFVLLAASANVAGLLLARATDREREFALRAALGAGWGRLVRQLLTESTLLALASAVVGVMLARWGLMLLVATAPVAMPRADRAPADPALFVIAAITGGIALVLFGLWPAVLAARTNLESVLRTVRHSAHRRSMRTREWLMAGQVAVALLLVAGAGLMHQTVDRLLRVDPGFDPRGVLSMGLSLVGPSWAEDSTVRAFQDELLRRVRSMPGVDAAAFAGQIPLGNNYDRWGFHIEGRVLASDADAPEVERYSVTPDYFRVMRIPLREGRLITEADTTGSLPVLVVNETTARTLWPGASPIGGRVRIGGNTGAYRTIVGVVGDVRHYELGAPPTTQMYVPQAQMTDSFLILVVRATANAGALSAPIRRTVTAIARDVPTYDVATLKDRLGHSVASRTFLMSLLGLFALTTLLMAAIGLYGVVSHGVATRRREFGIRLALGAARLDISWLVVRRGLWCIGGGVIAGLVASAFLGQVLGSQLYETTPADPIALAGSIAALAVVALVAHIAPLRRATAVDPAVTLRQD